jgi:hypothetical protein
MSTTYIHIVCPHVSTEIRGLPTQHRGFTGIYGVECAHHCRTRDKIRAKSEARRKWDHASQKYNYLFSRIIFDKGTDYALTGYSTRGRRFYRPYSGKGHLYTIKADLIEKAVTDGLFEALSSNRAIMRAVFDNRKIDKVAEELKARKSQCESEAKALEKKLARIKKAIITLDEENVGDFVLGLKMEIKEIEDRRAALKLQIQGIENRLSSIPTEQEVINHREWMHRQLMRKVAESHFTSGHTLEELPFEDKRKLLKLIFGGRDEDGARYGIIVNCLGGKPKRFKFEAYGRLGNLDGWIEPGNGKITAFADTKIYTHNNPEVVESIAGIFPINNSRENVKERLRGEPRVNNCHLEGGKSERRAQEESRALAESWDYVSLFRPLATWLARSCRPKCTRARSPTSLRS